MIPLRKDSSVPNCLIEIPKTPPRGHPASTSALEPILVVIMPGVAETFKSVIEETTYPTDFKVINFLHTGKVNCTHEDLNTSLDKPEN
jgi:hypothetical protein